MRALYNGAERRANPISAKYGQNGRFSPVGSILSQYFVKYRLFSSIFSFSIVELKIFYTAAGRRGRRPLRGGCGCCGAIAIAPYGERARRGVRRPIPLRWRGAPQGRGGSPRRGGWQSARRSVPRRSTPKRLKVVRKCRAFSLRCIESISLYAKF
jgi:hypothetical protein